MSKVNITHLNILQKEKIQEVQKQKDKGFLVYCESEEALQDHYSEVMNGVGLISEFVWNGAEVYKILAKQKIEMLVIEMLLPGPYDGLEVIKTIRSSLKLDFPIIVLSNLTSEKIVEEALSLGANEYLIKTDITNEELKTVLSQYTQSTLLERLNLFQDNTGKNTRYITPKKCEEYSKKQAKILETTCSDIGLKCKVAQIKFDRYFILVHSLITKWEDKKLFGKKVQEFKDALNVEYLRIQAPIPGTYYIGFEIPNPYPQDLYLNNAMKNLDILDYKFIKVLTVLAETQRADVKILLEETGLEEEELQKILNDMTNLKVIGKDTKLFNRKINIKDTSEVGKYWAKWKEMNK